MITRTIDHAWTEMVEVDGEVQKTERRVHLVIGGPADLRMGMRRSFLLTEQELLIVSTDFTGLRPDEIAVERALRRALYPDLMSAVLTQEGFEHWPITFEEWAALPEELGSKWEMAVAEINPRWRNQQLDEGDLETLRKKVMSTTTESSNGSKPRRRKSSPTRSSSMTLKGPGTSSGT